VNSEQANALVTGATGFIGRALCNKLRERGDKVVPLSCHGGTLLDGSPAVAIDLANDLSRTMPANLFEGIDVVYHLAGIAHQKASPAQYESINYQATIQIAEKAAKAGVKSFVYISSVKAMGSGDLSTPRDEDDCFTPEDAYGLSKWRAENTLRERYKGAGMTVTIIRPVLVYGPGVKGNVRQLTGAIRKGLPRPPSAGLRSIIALDDLCELILVAASTPASDVRTWIASGGDYSVQQIYDELRIQLGRAPGSSWTPAWLWRVASALLDVYSRSKPGSSYNKIFSSELYNSERVRSATDWEPVYTLEKICNDLLKVQQA
jgi:UDP-N-acetyl-alpha-D-quinovosamine dehydrogenase